MAATRAGSLRFRASKQVSIGTPAWWSIVPIAPSATNGPCRKRSRNGNNAIVGQPHPQPLSASQRGEPENARSENKLFKRLHARRAARIAERTAFHRNELPIVARGVQC